MEKAKVSFSRMELKRFLEKLASQVETGRISLEIPGHSKGKAKITPEQPIEAVFDKKDDDRTMTVEISFKDRRELEL